MMHLESYMVRKAVAFALVAGTLLVSACNTVSGAGKDVSSAGKAVSNTAEKSK
jgi:predicted small secreted protein